MVSSKVQLSRNGGIITKIKYNGPLDFGGMYRHIHQWLVDQKYWVHEKEYKFKVPTPLGSENEVTILAWRKENHYVKYHITVIIHAWDVHKVEVVKDGRKQLMDHVRMFIEIGGSVELDYPEQWTGSRLLVALEKFYKNYVIKRVIDGGWPDELFFKIWYLQTSIKEFLAMETTSNACSIRY